MKEMIREIYDYRQMVVGLVRRDLRGRYKGNVLGFLWTFINPLLQLLVYTLVFGVLFKNPMTNFYLYVFVGLIPWIFFSTCLTGGCGAVLDQGGLVTKVYFPREVLPISYVTSQFVNMLYCFVIVIAVYIFGAFSSVVSGVGIVWGLREGFSFLPILSLPLLFIIEYIMCIGMTLFTSAITVYVRDVKHILGIIGMLWMFASPIMWDISMLEGRNPIFKILLLYINPIGGLLEGYHNILYHGTWPDFSLLGVSFAWAALALIVGAFVFNRAKKRFAEEM